MIHTNNFIQVSILFYCHSTKDSILLYSWKNVDGWYTRDEIELRAATCSDLNHDDHVPVKIDDENYTVGVDFCIAMDENATCTKVLHKKDDGINEIGGVTKDLNEIVGMNQIAGENLFHSYQQFRQVFSNSTDFIHTIYIFLV